MKVIFYSAVVTCLLLLVTSDQYPFRHHGGVKNNLVIGIDVHFIPSSGFLVRCRGYETTLVCISSHYQLVFITLTRHVEVEVLPFDLGIFKWHPELGTGS